MNQIAWEMRHGLPNQTYLEFVAQYILPKAGQQTLVDPFALDVTDKIGDVYVVRQEVEREIGQLGTKIIVGREGSGKSSLFRKLSSLLPGQTLIVKLPIPEIGVPVVEQEFLDGQVSVLTSKLLIRYIFDAFWQDLLCNPLNRARFLPHLRREQGWMTTLRRFYHLCSPSAIGDEFELMAWLNASPSELLTSVVAPEDVLRELVGFITTEIPRRERFGVAPSQPYVRIQVLVDGIASLSNKAIARLAQDAQRLYDLHLAPVQFKLFADVACQPQMEAMDCVRRGHVALYCLPPWDAGGLRQMLHLRLKTCMQGASSEDQDYDLGRFIPAACLRSDARPPLVKTLINGALRVYQAEVKNDLDAPIHVLRLARGLVAACAGCWKEQGYQPPLDRRQIEGLVDLYWKN